MANIYPDGFGGYSKKQKKLGRCPKCDKEVESVAGSRMVGPVPSIGGHKAACDEDNVKRVQAQPMEWCLFPCEHWVPTEQANMIAKGETPTEEVVSMAAMGFVSTQTLVKELGDDWKEQLDEMAKEAEAIKTALDKAKPGTGFVPGSLLAAALEKESNRIRSEMEGIRREKQLEELAARPKRKIRKPK